MVHELMAAPRVCKAGYRINQRGAFFVSLAAGALLTVLALCASIYIHASDRDLLEQGIVNNADLISLGISQGDAREFAASTMAYLQGAVEDWQPTIIAGDHILPIPDSFRAHMADVKVWFSSAKAALLAALCMVLALFCSVLAGNKGSGKKGLSTGGYYLGVLSLLILFVWVGAWAYYDFAHLWDLLHKTLIPDGIFSAAEPIMMLFPLGLFEEYLQPVAFTFCGLTLAVLVLPLLLALLPKTLAKFLSRNKTPKESA